MTRREANQVTAALRFWQAVAEHSRRHPIYHPAVSELFDAEMTPLTDEEIDELAEVIEGGGYADAEVPEGSTVQTVCEYMSVSPRRVNRWIKRLGIKPQSRTMRTCFYSREDLKKVVRAIRVYDRRARRRYGNE